MRNISRSPLDVGRTAEQVYLPEILNDQAINFVKKAYEMMPEERRRSLEEFKYLIHFFPAFIKDRNKRAAEISSDKYKEIIEKAKDLLPMRVFSLMCMDGRIKPIHAYGLPAEIGHSIRTPGGMLDDFIQGTKRVWLKKGSEFAKQLKIRIDSGDEFCEVFDSHMACAARKMVHISVGEEQDDGLYEDVSDKRKMAEAVRDYVKDYNLAHPDKPEKYVPVIQTTFNPTTGYLYMGLETDGAREVALEHAKQVAASVEGRDPEMAKAVYSKQTLKVLLEKGKIISTGDLVNNNSAIREVFEANWFKADWKDNYVSTAVQFLSNAMQIKEALLPEFEKVVMGVYKDLNPQNEVDAKEITQRAMLLLTSSYNAFLHNRAHSEENYLTTSDEEYKKTVHYRYRDHEEQCVKVSERGGHPPYEIPAFLVSSLNKFKLPEYVQTAVGIVRENRLKKRAKEISGIFKVHTKDGLDAFHKSTVPLIVHAVVDGENLTQADWEILQNFDWDKFPKNWDTMSEKEFDSQIAKISPRLAAALIEGVKNIWHTTRAIYDKQNSIISKNLINQDILALPVLCDQSRQIRAIIPFIKVGHDEEEDSLPVAA